MQHEVLLQLSPKDAAQSAVISENIANELGLDPKRVTGFHLIKKSIDARKRNVLIKRIPATTTMANNAKYNRRFMMMGIED